MVELEGVVVPVVVDGVPVVVDVVLVPAVLIIKGI